VENKPLPSRSKSFVQPSSFFKPPTPLPGFNRTDSERTDDTSVGSY
jgi:hypothetical protein